MEYIKHTSAVIHRTSPNCKAYEYPMENSEMNMCVVEISERYPENGYAKNRKCSEMGYILKGSGKLVTETDVVALTPGDLVFIPRGEKYYWEGNMMIVLSATPAWHPEQHETNLTPYITSTHE